MRRTSACWNDAINTRSQGGGGTGPPSESFGKKKSLKAPAGSQDLSIQGLQNQCKAMRYDLVSVDAAQKRPNRGIQSQDPQNPFFSSKASFLLELASEELSTFPSWVSDLTIGVSCMRDDALVSVNGMPVLGICCICLTFPSPSATCAGYCAGPWLVSASCPTSTALDGAADGDASTLETCSSGWDGSIAASLACSPR